MKLIIAGGRNAPTYAELEDLWKYLDRGIITEVVSGCAKGADTLGEEWATKNNIPIKKFPADWETHGKGAGFIRNKEMVDYADSLLVIWDGVSKGTQHTVSLAKTTGMPYYIHKF